MTKARDIAGLSGLAQVMLDLKLGRLREAAGQLERSRQQLAAINAAARPADLPVVAAEKVALDYDRWADVRRSELNLVIARQTAALIETRAEAGTAFGRLQALNGLRERQKLRG